MAITRVQGNARGTGTTGSITMAMASTPISGNVLIAVIGLTEDGGATDCVYSITQTGVTWSLVIAKTIQSCMDGEIWLGVVSSGASKTVVINFSGTAHAGSVADVCEYSGIATNPTDKTASASGSDHNPKTGTTDTTTQAEELWVGCISTYGTQTTPENGFTLLDGAQYGGYMSLGFLEKIVSSVGQAQSGVTTSDTFTDWSDCIATFKAAAAGGPTVKKGSSLVNTMTEMLNSKMLFSACNRFPKLTTRRF